jgi:hypothetical protein
MKARDAEQILQREDLVVLMQGAMSYIKEIRDRCLAAEIPVLLGACPGTS